jgi:serine protease
MAQKKIIYSVSLQEFRPIIWYGEPIFTRYNQLKSILTEKLGEKYADFLSEPVVSKEMIEGKGKAHWMSEHVTNGVPFSKLNPQQQEQARQLLQLFVNKIKNFAKELQGDENPNLKELGELLLLAIEVPGLDYIFVEGDRICLVLWGFSSEESKKVNFQISKVIEAPVGYIPPQNISEQLENNIVDDKVKIEKQLDENDQKVVDNKQIKTTNAENIQAPPPPPPPVDTKKKKKGIPGWLWFLLGVILTFLILFLLWWFLLRNSHNALPDEAGVLPPIDTTQLGVDPDDPSQKPIFTNKVNVALKKDADLVAFAEKLQDDYKDYMEVVYYDTTINLLQIQTPDGDWKRWKDTLKTFSEVRLTFNESLFEGGKIPTDPAFKQPDKNWYFDVIGVYNAWEISQGSDSVIVAIIDDGFDISHPEFKNKIVNPWNVVTHSTDLFPSGGSEHGTHVAATAVGWNDNKEGLCGIAPKCKLMPIQIGDADGLMSSLSIVSGILYAIHHDADVVNMSIGTYYGDDVLMLSEEEQRDLISYYPDEAAFWDDLFLFANETDLIIVQAAGNQDILAGIDPFSRSLRNVVVAAIDTSKNKADFSNYGEFSTVSAPGVSIYSAIPGNNFEFLDGTSMASPIVTGAIALIKSVHPDWTSDEVISALVNSAIPVNSTQYVGPLIQLDKALIYDPSDSILIIPDNPEDLTFAEGLWESSNSLVSTIDGLPVTLLFDLKADGTGELTLTESNGTKCKADLTLSLDNGTFVIVQDDNAECSPENKFYYPYLFECEQGDGKEADCTAKQLDGTGDLLDFKLYKKN